MAESFTPLTLANINGQVSSAVTSINQNFATLQSLLLDVLSLSGAKPNSMQSNLDMNQFNIINLPYATASGEPVTFDQLALFTGASFPVINTLPIQSQINTITNLSIDLGPAGKNWAPFSTVKAINYMEFSPPSTHNNVIQATLALANVSNGSGTFGPGSADSCLFISGSKSNWLTNLTTGEIDAIYMTVRQGATGDAAGVLIDAEKVRGTGGDTGSILGIQANSFYVNTSGTPTLEISTVTSFAESVGGVSGGQGYGYYSESWLGQTYSAYHVDTFNNVGGSAGTYGWQYAFDATLNRTGTSRYFAIRGDIVTGSQIAGDIIQGVTGNQKIIRTSAGGVLQIRNSADSATLVSVSDIGLTTIGGGTGVQQLVINSGNSGSGVSSSIQFQAAGAVLGYLGGAAGILGGAYTTDQVLYTANKLKIYANGVDTLDFLSTGLSTIGSLILYSATAVPAGGTAAAGLMFSSTANFGVFFGSGVPSLSAAQGSLYLRTDGSSGTTRMYVNSTGSTTWVAVNTAS